MLQDFHFLSRSAALIRCYWKDLNSPPPLHLLVRREYFSDDDNSGQHRHEDFYALYVVRGGKGTHVINNHPYAMARGDVYIMPPGAVHNYRDYRNLEVDAFYFQTSVFSLEELEALRALHGFWNLFVQRVPESQEEEVDSRRLHLSPDSHAAIEAIISEMRAEVVASPEGRLIARHQFFRLMVWLARRHAESHHAGRRLLSTHKRGHDVKHEETRHKSKNGEAIQFSQEGSLADVLRVCEERFQEPLSVPFLAGLMFLSPSRFSAVFTQEMGMPPAAYLRRLRLERAQSLLRSTMLSAAEVARQSGFGETAQMTRTFRSILNTTPSEYRAAFKRAR